MIWRWGNYARTQCNPSVLVRGGQDRQHEWQTWQQEQEGGGGGGEGHQAGGLENTKGKKVGFLWKSQRNATWPTHTLILDFQSVVP